MLPPTGLAHENEVVGMMHFLVGVRDQAYLFPDAGVDAPDRHVAGELRAMMNAKAIARRKLYEYRPRG